MHNLGSLTIYLTVCYICVIKYVTHRRIHLRYNVYLIDINVNRRVDIVLAKPYQI